MSDRTARRIAERITGPDYAAIKRPESSVRVKREGAVVSDAVCLTVVPHPRPAPNEPRVAEPVGASLPDGCVASRSAAPAVSVPVYRQCMGGMHPPRVCPVCQSAFVPGRSDQTYHSRACKEAASHRRSHPLVSGSPVASLCRCCGRSFGRTRGAGRPAAYCGDACRDAAALWRADVRWWAEVAAGWAPTRDAEMIEWSRSRLAQARALSGVDYLKTHPWPVSRATPGMERMLALCQTSRRRPLRS
jgi:hypothetical protein